MQEYRWWRVLAGMRDRISGLAPVIDSVDPLLVCAGATDGIYESADGGETWASMGKDMAQVTVTTLALQPTARPTPYGGSEHQSIFRGSDAGDHWTPSGLGG